MADEEDVGRGAAPDPSAKQDGGTRTLSPYVGGGGGSVFAHRIATSYLADLLLGAGRPETDELPVVSVAFQTNPIDPVDDLRVEAERDDARVVVHIAARRTPNFTKGHTKTAELVGTLLDQIDAFGDNDRAYVAVALVGMSNPQREVQRLASLARDNESESAFYAQVHEEGRHAGLAKRYAHLTGLVSKARPKAATDTLRALVWSLVRRLWVLDFRVESDDEMDWVEIGNRLNPLAREGKSGADVRNDLHSAGATQFDQKGTAVNRSLVRRRIHSALASDAGRSKAAWEQLLLEQNLAMVAVRHELAGAVELPRARLLTAAQAALAAAGAARGAVLFTGESGIGKSSLTLSAATALAATNSDFQHVVLNLRRTRDSVAALSADLGMPLSDALSEMSAPARVLIVDAADAALEGRGPLLRELAAAAHEAEVGLALVAADTAAEDAAGTLVGIYAEPMRFEVPGLDDAELRVVGAVVPAIAGALRNLPTKSLYRRLAIVDLLARTGTTVTTPLDDWACLELIWKNLIGRAVGGSSAAARTEALLSMSEVELELPEEERSYPRPDPAALDALRADLLVAPENLRKAEPKFAHDEVRRFATAVLLARTDSVTAVLRASGPARWSMSAAKLACEGKLAGAEDPNAELTAQVAQFDALGDESTVRWKDVPLEAVLEMPNAYELLRDMHDADPPRSSAVLATFVRVVSLHQRHDGMVDVPRGEAVVRLLVEKADDLWREDDEVFRLVCEWLNSSLLDDLPVGNPTRIALRDLLLDHWRTHRPPKTPADTTEKPEEEVVFNIFDGHTKSKRRKRTLNWQVTEERYVQLVALLGPDINDEVRAYLSEVAADSPSHLQPAVDLDWSAWGLSSYDPEFLLELTAAYYIDNRGGGSWRHWNGIRDHQSRGFRGLTNHAYGPFWVLMLTCPHEDWAPVVNQMLNHAANIRCRSEDSPGTVDPGSTFTLAIDGIERTYVGDASVWGWYRGNTNGPYPCMSALQAVERWVDRAVANGAAIEDVARSLLNGCENLAMPALIVGAIGRHLEEGRTALDPYLREPLVWEFEFMRANNEAIGFMRASDEGIANAGRRTRNMRDISSLLVLQADASRRAELKELSADLVANIRHFDLGATTLRGWAAHLDAANMRSEPVAGGLLISVEQPEEVEAELGPMRAEFTRTNALLGLQNKYWIPARQKATDWTPPTTLEIAEDLATAKALYEDPPGFAASDPLLTVAFVAAAAIKSAAIGLPEALGADATFAVASVLSILGGYADENDDDSLLFENDIGTRGAAASAVPCLVLPELADQVEAAGATPDDVAAAAETLGTSAATATCLQFARGCDIIWNRPCSGDLCIHVTVYQWVLDLARACEIGDFDYETQRSPRQFITGDVMARIPDIPPDKLDTARLSATIRALGNAASSSACVAEVAQGSLAALLRAQTAAMVHQESSENVFFIDDQGAQTMSAARALLHSSRRSVSSRDLLTEYLTTLTPDSHLLSAFLRDLASVGAETQELAAAAATVWPTVITHALDQVEQHTAIYNIHDTFNDYALSHLIPNLGGLPDALHSELGRDTFDWVDAEELAEFVPRWIPVSAGRSACLLALVQFLRQLPVERQLADGLGWIAELCLSDQDKQLPTYAPMDEWLVEIKPEADARGAGDEWLNLVDRLVYAGNRTLATYSR